MSKIEIAIADHFDNRDNFKIDHADLKRTIEHVLHNQQITSGSISLAIVDDQAIMQLKEKYFGISATTDVVSFDLSDRFNQPPRPELDCEVVVNAQKALEVAEQRQTDLRAELNLYVVHGLLHQLGYDDHTEQQAQAMHQREDQLLSELGFGKVFNSAR